MRCAGYLGSRRWIWDSICCPCSAQVQLLHGCKSLSAKAWLGKGVSRHGLWRQWPQLGMGRRVILDAVSRVWLVGTRRGADATVRSSRNGNTLFHLLARWYRMMLSFSFSPFSSLMVYNGNFQIYTEVESIVQWTLVDPSPSDNNHQLISPVIFKQFSLWFSAHLCMYSWVKLWNIYFCFFPIPFSHSSRC